MRTGRVIKLAAQSEGASWVQVPSKEKEAALLSVAGYGICFPVYDKSLSYRSYITIDTCDIVALC